MSIRELKHQLGDTQSKALRNFSGFLDTLSTFDLKTDKKKIPKKDTVRIARSTLSNFLLENPNQSRILTEKEKEETHPSTASYLVHTFFNSSPNIKLYNRTFQVHQKCILSTNLQDYRLFQNSLVMLVIPLKPSTLPYLYLPIEARKKRF